MCDDPQLPEPLAKMRQKLDGSKEDKRLYELIENFYHQGSNKIKRSRAFASLLAELKKLSGLKRPLEYHPEYEDILQETWGLVAQKIFTEFDPQGRNLRNSLVLWINEKLRLKYKVMGLFSTGRRPEGEDKPKTAKQELAELIRQKPQSLDVQVSYDSDDSQPLTLKDLIADPNPNFIEKLEREELKKAIEELNRPSRNYPQCTCLEIAKGHILKQPPDTIAQIATDLGMNYQTVHSHWRRNCKPLLAEIWKQFNLGE